MIMQSSKVKGFKMLKDGGSQSEDMGKNCAGSCKYRALLLI